MSTVNPPFVSTPSLGLDTFSSANKEILKNRIKNALEKAFKSTYLYDTGEDGNEIADKFASTASAPLADSITDYIKEFIKSQIVIVNPVTAGWTTAMGPVAGSPASTMTKSISIS